ncbi:hypothetical protein SPRG_07463 [Saprolegnia parasitica CBS 223.65]|uniref:Uncharacterized protein n=1 Tax=Saprolegnia parasitica (strain CBS 223.65) TaxID=695850 RepID=A0A067C900_SAPPC|nr:hypothetical protein SPRG_07463 [Saprolegnia parasitica CBS 223.65]KDO27214.1 hypothetical protein SPRG_07463 [Saprolegnia parasitica CBS 223.65]|eukprot:XP_012201992.1 hypothetical protein SPRG_07463 [Saprolegnia parasitica CBS 223.65]
MLPSKASRRPLSKQDARRSFIELTRQASMGHTSAPTTGGGWLSIDTPLHEKSTDNDDDDGDDLGSRARSHDPPSLGMRAKSNVRIGSLDLYAAFAVFGYYLVTFETLVVSFNTVLATSAYYYIDTHTDAVFNYNLSWTLVTFAIVSPIIMQTQQAYNRRENALLLVAETKALMLNVYVAHHQWIAPAKQACVPTTLLTRTRLLVRGIMYDLCELVSLPNVTRGRHRFTSTGVRESQAQQAQQQTLRSRLAVGLEQLHGQVRDLKCHGLSEGEASRLYQYLWMIHSRVLSLINIKMYRTPQATRSFTKVLVHILPFFYGPYYVNVASGDGSSNRTNFAFALAFAILTSLMMIGILNAQEALEDPFSGDGLDVVHMESMFDRLEEDMAAMNDGAI